MLGWLKKLYWLKKLFAGKKKPVAKKSKGKKVLSPRERKALKQNQRASSPNNEEIKEKPAPKKKETSEAKEKPAPKKKEESEVEKVAQKDQKSSEEEPEPFEFDLIIQNEVDELLSKPEGVFEQATVWIEATEGGKRLAVLEWMKRNSEFLKISQVNSILAKGEDFGPYRTLAEKVKEMVELTDISMGLKVSVQGNDVVYHNKKDLQLSTILNSSAKVAGLLFSVE